MVIRKILLAGIFWAASQAALAADAINTSWLGNLAIEGYDPVAYFTEGKAVEGEKKFQLEWMGAKWRFASAEHMELFRSNPEQYAPQYGGYCAYAVSNDDLAGIDPEQFHIYNGKLYLNYNADIQEKWLPEKVERIEAADKYYPGLVD